MIKNITFKSIKLKRPAFTLFELMVVIVIIGVVYSLVLGSFNPKKSVKVINLENIKDALTPHWTKGVRVDLYVYDRCRKSILFINDEAKEDVEVELNSNMFKDIKAYKSDQHAGKRELTFSPIVIDKKIHKVCFQYTLFPNGSSSSFIIKSGKKYYTFFPYFEKTYITSKLDDALEHYLKEEFTKIRSQ